MDLVSRETLPVVFLDPAKLHGRDLGIFMNRVKLQPAPLPKPSLKQDPYERGQDQPSAEDRSPSKGRVIV